jgi:predicted small metal-binding protein
MRLEFRCRDVGVVCNEKVTAETPGELLEKIAEHADHAHGVPELTETLVDYAQSVVTEK